jgi:hypothetical protein
MTGLLSDSGKGGSAISVLITNDGGKDRRCTINGLEPGWLRPLPNFNVQIGPTAKFKSGHFLERTTDGAAGGVRPDVSVGSNSEVGPLERHVRSTPNSRRRPTMSGLGHKK